MEIAHRHKLAVIEDGSQSFGAMYQGQPAGSVEHIATFSFHAAKVITSGEGGMVLCRDAALVHRCRAEGLA